jgi:hypothetical protein
MVIRLLRSIFPLQREQETSLQSIHDPQVGKQIQTKTEWVN